jgi:HEAT repeat protein
VNGSTVLYHYVIGFSSTASSLDEETHRNFHGLLHVLDAALRAVLPAPDFAKISISPTGFLIAIQEAEPKVTRSVVEAAISFHRLRSAVPMRIAISAGPVREVKENWLTRSFEGAPPIVVSRLLSKLDNGAVAIHLYADEIAVRAQWPDYAVAVRSKIAGKHSGESFEALLLPGVAVPSGVATASHSRTDASATPHADYVARLRTYLAHFRVENYIELHVEPIRRSLGRVRGAHIGDSDLDLSEAVAAAKRPVVLIGGPGAGKTTILAEYMSDLMSDPDTIPAYAPLGFYRTSTDLLSLLDLREFTAPEITEMLDSGRITIAWDGANEAGRDCIDEIFVEILALQRRFPKIRQVVTCRESELPGWVGGNMDLLQMLPVPDAEVEKQFLRVLGPGVGRDALSAMRDSTLGSVDWRRLCQTPLLLTMTLSVIVDRPEVLQQSATAIKSKADLYAVFMNQLRAHEREKPRATSWLALMPTAAHELVLQQIAYRMEISDSVFVDELVVQKWTADVSRLPELKEWWPGRQQPANTDVFAAVAHHVPMRSFTLPSRPPLYGFLHQSFIAYYAGMFVSQSLKAGGLTWADVGRLLDARARKHWELAEFWVGIEDDASEVVEFIARHAARRRAQELLVLAGAGVRNAKRISVAVADDVRLRLLDAFKNWNIPFDYDLIQSVFDSFKGDATTELPPRLRYDADRFAKKYAQSPPIELVDVATEALRELVVGPDELRAVDAVFTLGRRRFADQAERHDTVLFLLDAITRVSPRIREQAVVALKELGDTAAINVLTELVRDRGEGARTRAYALNALAECGDIASADVIIEYLLDITNPYRDSASWSLQMLGRKAKEVGDRRIDDILNAYRIALSLPDTGDERRYCRGNVLYSLGALQGDVAIVLNAIEGEDDPYILEDAIQALGMLQEERAIPFLRKHLHADDPALRLKAAEAIGQINVAAALPDLQTLLNDKYGVVADAARKALDRNS